MTSQDCLCSLIMSHFARRKHVYLAPFTDNIFGNKILNLLLGKKSFTGSLLELGTGCGRLLSYLLQKGLNVEMYGIDICRTLVKAGKRRYGKNINFVVADARCLPFRNESFECIVTSQMLHHLVGKSPKACHGNVAAAFRESTRILKINGLMALQEECVRAKIQSLVLFLITRTLARLNVSIPYFYIYAKVIVHFLTPKEVYTLLTACHSMQIYEWQEEEDISWKIRDRFTLIMYKVIWVRFVALKSSERMKPSL